MNKFIVTIHRKDQVLSREVNKDSFTMGRSLDCDLSLNDTNISRVHLVVSRRWNQIWIEDKNSSNGTYINGTRIVQGTPVNVVPSDRIQLGRSEYILNVDLELDEPAPEPDPEPSYQPAPPVEEEDAPLEATVAMPAPNMAPFQAEKILHEAKRKAAQIILEGETQAEKRVQVIYQKAREAQAQAEIFYQARMAEAHKEADAILMDFQKQGQSLLHDARKMAQELREEVDSYVQGLRQKAKKDAEEIVSEGTLAAEKMKDEALASGRELARQESQELLKTAREEADRILDFSKLQIEETQARIRSDLEKSQQEIQLTLQNAKEDAARILAESEELLAKNNQRISDDSARAKLENESLIAAAKSEAEQMIQTAEQKVAEIKSVSDEKQAILNELLENVAARTAELQKATEDLNKTRTDNADLLSQVGNAQALLKDLQVSHEELEKQKTSLETSLKSLQEKQAHLTMDVHDIESKKTHLFKEYEAQKIFLNEKLEKEKSQMARSEEERLEELRLEMAKKMQKMERDLLDDVIRKKSSLVKEIHAAIEKEVVMLMEPEKWRNISQSVENHITEAIEGKVATLSQSSMAEKPVDLMKKRKSEKMRWVTLGLAMGAIGYFVSQIVVNKVIRDQTPMQTMVSLEAKKRQDELEKRRFNPAQAEEIKDTYTDAVIYTRNYLDIYTDAQFQQKLYKAASAYLLKTWRVDEDKSIQVISASNALVKELAEKRAKIHPDFIKEGIEKMRELENQTLARMKTTLGSEVRLESYRRFEKNFYMEEVKRRRMANY